MMPRSIVKALKLKAISTGLNDNCQPGTSSPSNNQGAGNGITRISLLQVEKGTKYTATYGAVQRKTHTINLTKTMPGCCSSGTRPIAGLK